MPTKKPDDEPKADEPDEELVDYEVRPAGSRAARPPRRAPRRAPRA